MTCWRACSASIRLAQTLRMPPHERAAQHRRPLGRSGRSGRELLPPVFPPRGRKQGNYWQVGDTSGGAKGQSLAIRLQAQGGRKAGSWADFATGGQYGDLIDLLQERLGSVTLKETLREAQSFLGEAPPCAAVPRETRKAERRMQPPANASRGRGSSLPQASRSSALWRPPICRGARDLALRSSAPLSPAGLPAPRRGRA